MHQLLYLSYVIIRGTKGPYIFIPVSTIMDWHARAAEIQERFFRQGPYAYLCISEDSQTETRWTFNFMDLGMCHTLSGSAMVSFTPTGTYLVNKQECEDEDSALEAVFSGHYREFLSRFYLDMGVVV